MLQWGADEIYKAKSCEEMLMFEKIEQHSDKSWPEYAQGNPDKLVLSDFDENLKGFIETTEAGTNMQPLNLAAEAKQS